MTIASGHGPVLPDVAQTPKHNIPYSSRDFGPHTSVKWSRYFLRCSTEIMIDSWM